MAKRKGSEFLRYCIPIVEVLRELGGSGRPAEVTDLVIDRMNIPEAEQQVTNKGLGNYKYTGYRVSKRRHYRNAVERDPVSLLDAR